MNSVCVDDWTAELVIIASNALREAATSFLNVSYVTRLTQNLDLYFMFLAEFFLTNKLKT